MDYHSEQPFTQNCALFNSKSITISYTPTKNYTKLVTVTQTCVLSVMNTLKH